MFLITPMYKKTELFQALMLWSILHSSIHLEWQRVCHVPIQDHSKTYESYVWNKSDLSFLDYQQRYCEMRCKGNELITYRLNKCWDLECIQCHCERPACEHYRICCPDISVPFERMRVIMGDPPRVITEKPFKKSEARNRSTTPVLGCEYHPGLDHRFLFIRSCQADYDDNQTVIDMCEMDRQPQEQTMETFIKVVDLERQTVYKNKFCAQCNHVTNFTSVPTTIRTNNFTAYYRAMSRSALLQQVLQGVIEITPAFPENFTLLDCPFSKEVPIDYCTSKSGYIPNPELVRACETGQFGNEFVVFSLATKLYYTNIFCAICDKFGYPRTFTQCICETTVFPNKLLPFSMLLDPSSRNRIEKTGPITVSSIPASQCSFNEWPSVNGDCHPLLCGPGKEFLDGKCTVKVEEIKGLSYRLRLWLQPIPSDSLGQAEIFAKKTFNLMFLKIQEMVEEFSTNYKLDVRGLTDTNSIPFLKFPAIFWMECLLFAHQNIIRNDFDIQILNQFMSENISVQNFENIKLIVKPIQMLPRFVVEKSVAQNLINQSRTVYLHAGRKSESFITGLEVDYISVNHVLICRFVRFEPEQYQAAVRDDVIPPDFTVTIDLNGTKILITDTADLNMVDIGQDGELNVCEDLLNSKLKMSKEDVLEGTNRELAGTSLAEYIVSIACSSASILCLVLTLMTYILFSELRTEAGLNNMFLSSSLLLAQVCLMITSHIFRSSTMCTVLGVVTHFLWLWMFSWSFLCSYHMFQVFTSNTSRTSSQQDVFMVWKKILFSLTCPSAIILTTVVGSYLASSGKEIGYGRFSCYLNSTLLVGLTLVWPLSLVTLTNVVLFTVDVNKSHGGRKLQSIFKRNEWDNECHIYAMISSVTLAFWTVTIVACALGNDYLRLISIVLNGLQGVAIFVSFICNKRVLLLYKQMRCFKREAKTEDIRIEPIHSD